MPKNDTDDVLDFINSLPDSKSGTPRPVNGQEEKGEDLLEFLDELAAQEKPKNATKSKSFEPKKKEDEPKGKEASAKTEKQEKVQKNEKPPASESNKSQDPAATEAQVDDGRSETPEIIGSITNWWSTEGSLKVSLFWGSLTSNAEKLGEQTYQLASSTTNQINQQRQRLLSELGIDPNANIVGLTSRLNSVLVSMSQQIAQGLAGESDELLNVLLIHDLYNIKYLDRLCQDKFSHVTGQVEGGISVNVSNFNHRDDASATDFNMFYGKIIDGEKLCFANLESSIKDYVKVMKVDEEARKNVEEETKNAGNDETPEAPTVNSSNIFVSIQPISSGSTSESEEKKEGPILIEANNSDSFLFTLILKDITNDITIITKTQPFPLRWSRWVCGEFQEFAELEEIDPSEWVKDWIGDGLGLAFGVLAQEYVVKRMGY
jgi:hypothetical protein